MPDYLLQMNGIVKTFGGVKALNGIDIQVRPGECVGLCGENGAGKSTLMKVLSAVYPYGTWEGEILWDGQPLKAQSISETEAAGIVIIHQELTLVPDLSVAENIFMGHEITLPGGRMNYPAMIHRAEALMRELKVPDMNVSLPVSQYGGGHQQLVEIAKALNKQARLLILDEPSSALTRSEIEVLLDIIRDLKAKGVACVYISHKLDEVAAVCDTISVIRDGKHIATTAMTDMDIPKIITQMVGREMSNLYPTEPHDIGEVIFEARHVTCYDVDNPRRKRVDDISFVLKRGKSSASPDWSAPVARNWSRRCSAPTPVATKVKSGWTASPSTRARRSSRSVPACAWFPKTASAKASFQTWAWDRTSPSQCWTTTRN